MKPRNKEKNMETKLIITTLLLGLITINSFSQTIVWEAKASLPYQIYSGSAVTCQGINYFVGGQKDIGSGNFIASNMIFEYNLAMDEWVEKPNMSTAHFNSAVASVDDKIYVIGGDSFLDQNEMYDPATEIWQILTPMPTARQHIKAAVVDDKIYIIGGLESWDEVSTKNEVYDPQTDTWDEMAPIPIPKHNYSTVVYNDEIYIFGGCTQNGVDIWSMTSSVEVYNPAANSWTTTSSLPSTRFNPGIGIIDDKIIIAGGFSDDEVVSDVDVFDPVSSTWTESTSLPEKNVAMGSTTLNDKIYIIGGTSGPAGWQGYNTVYEGVFDESTGNEQLTDKDELLVFPNPAKGYIQVQYSDDNSNLKTFQILTVGGKIIKEGRLESERINISDLSKGVFLLNIKTDESIITKKIVIE